MAKLETFTNRCIILLENSHKSTRNEQYEKRTNLQAFPIMYISFLCRSYSTSETWLKTKYPKKFTLIQPLETINHCQAPLKQIYIFCRTWFQHLQEKWIFSDQKWMCAVKQIKMAEKLKSQMSSSMAFHL